MLGKLLCTAALVSAALAQNIDIAIPVEGTKVTAGSVITVQLERPVRATSQSCLFLLPPPPLNIDTQTPSTDIEEVSVVIGFSPCPAGCINEGLGTILYNGTFDPESANSAGNAFQDFSVTVPSWFNGPAQLRVAHYYLQGVRITLSFTLGTDADTLCKSTTELQLTNTNVTVVGASG